MSDIEPGVRYARPGIGLATVTRWLRRTLRATKTAAVREYDSRAFGGLDYAELLALSQDLLRRLNGWDEATGGGPPL